MGSGGRRLCPSHEHADDYLGHADPGDEESPHRPFERIVAARADIQGERQEKPDDEDLDAPVYLGLLFAGITLGVVPVLAVLEKVLRC